MKSPASGRSYFETPFPMVLSNAPRAFFYSSIQLYRLLRADRRASTVVRKCAFA